MKKTYNKPDLNAPRHKVTRLSGANIKFYNRFYKKYPEYKHIPASEIKKILVAFNINMRDTIIDERDGVEFPERLGFSFVGSCPPKIRDNPNRSASKEHSLDIQHTNMNSDGLVAKIFYSNYSTGYAFKMRELWMFKGTREFSRGVSAAYKDKWKSYIQVDNYTRIRKLYNKLRQKNFAIKNAKSAGPNYNEFDLN